MIQLLRLVAIVMIVPPTQLRELISCVVMLVCNVWKFYYWKHTSECHLIHYFLRYQWLLGI